EILSPGSLLQTTKATLLVSGRAQAGSPLTIYDGGGSNISLTAEADGTFSSSVSLDYGTNLLTAVESVMGTNYASAPVEVILTPSAPFLSAASASGPSLPVSGGGLAGASVNIFN